MATKKTESLADIQRQIADLERRAEVARRTEIAEVVKGIRGAMDVYGLTLADIGLSGRGTRGQRKLTQRGPTDAKYGDGRGNTWTGRGPRPLWLREAINAGKPLEQFLLDAKATVAPTRKASAAKAKYCDGKGNEWGGRGPRPRWLRQALAEGKKLEDFS